MREEFKSYCYEGVHPDIVINKAKHLTKEQTLTVLKKILETIKNEQLWGEDSTAIGNKHTHCNWGVCTNSLKVYSKPEMHTFPQDFVDHGRSSPLSLKNISCPMRKGKNQNGCFYQCRVFQESQEVPAKEEAIKLYEKTIQKLERKSI